MVSLGANIAVNGSSAFLKFDLLSLPPLTELQAKPLAELKENLAFFSTVNFVCRNTPLN